MSSLFKRTAAITPMTPNEDHTGKEGYLVKYSSGKAAINDSATVPALGVILDGEATTGRSSIGWLGALSGTVRMRAGAAVTAGSLVIQINDGTIKDDTGSGGRVVVGRAVESGVAGENLEVVPCTPLTLS